MGYIVVVQKGKSQCCCEGREHRSIQILTYIASRFGSSFSFYLSKCWMLRSMVVSTMALQRGDFAGVRAVARSQSFGSICVRL